MSYAIIRTGGKQYRVEPGKSLRIPSLPGDVGTHVEFNEVLLGSDGTTVRAGVPILTGAKVPADITKQGRGDKIVVYLSDQDKVRSDETTRSATAPTSPAPTVQQPKAAPASPQPAAITLAFAGQCNTIVRHG